MLNPKLDTSYVAFDDIIGEMIIKIPFSDTPHQAIVKLNKLQSMKIFC